MQFILIVILTVFWHSVSAASDGTSIIVIKPSYKEFSPPPQNFTQTTNGTEFPLQTEEPETSVASSSLVLDNTATQNSLLKDSDKPSTKNFITIQTFDPTEEVAASTNDESVTVYDGENPATISSSPVVVINLTTVEGNTTTAATTTSTELNLIPPANVNSSIQFMNETRKNSQIIIR